MRLGSWVFCKTNDLSVSYYYPYSKKGRNLAFQPYFCLDTPNGEIIVDGKRALWSLLDSLFPDNPLPRHAINDDLKDPFIGREVINGLLQDEEAWPYLRLQVRTGDWKNHEGKPNYGTFILSVSPSASDFDITPTLLMLENTTPKTKSLPISIQTKTTMKTIPSIVIPLDEDEDYKVVVTDAISGEHLIFSVIEKSFSVFRPQRMTKLPTNDILKIQKEIQSRLDFLKIVKDQRIVFPQMSPLDAGMRFYERDDLEFRRFQSINSFSSLESLLKE